MEFPRPQMVLNVAKLENNISVMADWAASRSLYLAPHIKTTMTRQIVERQVDAGAWAVTVVNPQQARIAFSWGLRRLIIANEIVDPLGLAAMRSLLEEDDETVMYVLADSRAGVERMSTAFASLPGRLRVLLDVGAMGGRTGVRTLDDALNVARAIRDAPALLFAGVSAYEGVAPEIRRPDVVEQVDHHLSLAVDAYDALHDLMSPDPIFTAGGSAFPDRAAVHLPSKPHTPVLRSGSYVTHDHGVYAGVCPVEGLQPAVTVHTVVASVPEPGLAVLNAGKRDLPYDAGLPVVVRVTADGGEKPVAGTVERLFDHHAVVHGADLAVGDTVALGISHPCGVFDRWRVIEADLGGTSEAWNTEF